MINKMGNFFLQQKSISVSLKWKSKNVMELRVTIHYRRNERHVISGMVERGEYSADEHEEDGGGHMSGHQVADKSDGGEV